MAPSFVDAQAERPQKETAAWGRTHAAVLNQSASSRSESGDVVPNQFAVTSSMKKLVASDESSVPVKASVIVWPEYALMLKHFCE